jgi:hypothetical protein
VLGVDEAPPHLVHHRRFVLVPYLLVSLWCHT